MRPAWRPGPGKMVTFTDHGRGSRPYSAPDSAAIRHASFNSPRPCLPTLSVRCVGIVVGLSLVLTSWKLDVYADLPWWVVFLPIIIALCMLFVLMTVAVAAWTRVAFVFFSGRLEVNDEIEFRLDVLFRAAKICFLGHGLVMLLMLSLGLLLMKLHVWLNVPAVYPLLPLIVLGTACTFLGLIFKQPEVDSPWFLLVGLSLLSQSIMLVIKLDYMHEARRLPWAVTFTPSWITYVLLLIYCVVSPVQICHQAQGSEASGSASSCETPYGATEACAGQDDNKGLLHAHLFKVSGIACWVIGWCLSQAILTLRLDALYKVAWLSVILPALVGWILLFIFATDSVSKYVADVSKLLLATFSLAPLCECCKSHSPVDEEPLINYGNLRNLS